MKEIQELIKWIEKRMSLYPDMPNLSERGAYDAYLNVLNECKNRLNENTKTDN